MPHLRTYVQYYSFNYFNLFTEVSAICEDGGVRPPWLLWLAITLGILFLIMLLMNIFLCTAMSCSCARTEVTTFQKIYFEILRQKYICNFFLNSIRSSKKNHRSLKNMTHIVVGMAVNTDHDIHFMDVMDTTRATLAVVQRYILIGLIDIKI